MNCTFTHVIDGYKANVRSGIKGDVVLNSCRMNTPRAAKPTAATTPFHNETYPDELADITPTSRATSPIVKNTIPGASIIASHLRMDMRPSKEAG
ncbi:hypothetical protein J25TS5_25030 [Paenibacillus faecis]|nr:hypothetical protein J25TS5_25030 [Paenibacillus faecis]